jgi:hypothetical protein
MNPPASILSGHLPLEMPALVVFRPTPGTPPLSRTKREPSPLVYTDNGCAARRLSRFRPENGPPRLGVARGCLHRAPQQHRNRHAARQHMTRSAKPAGESGVSARNTSAGVMRGIYATRKGK